MRRSLISSTGLFVKSIGSFATYSFCLTPLEKHKYCATVYLPERLTIGVPPAGPDFNMPPVSPKAAFVSTFKCESIMLFIFLGLDYLRRSSAPVPLFTSVYCRS